MGSARADFWSTYPTLPTPLCTSTTFSYFFKCSSIKCKHPVSMYLLNMTGLPSLGENCPQQGTYRLPSKFSSPPQKGLHGANIGSRRSGRGKHGRPSVRRKFLGHSPSSAHAHLHRFGGTKVQTTTHKHTQTHTQTHTTRQPCQRYNTQRSK